MEQAGLGYHVASDRTNDRLGMQIYVLWYCFHIFSNFWNWAIVEKNVFEILYQCVFLGRVPMRHLVYRVQPLPPSLFSLVYDFGQIDSQTEMQYIEKMSSKKVFNMWMLQIFLWNFLFTTISHCIDDKSIFQLRFESGLSRPRTAGGRRGLQMPSSMQTMQTVVCKVLQRSQEYMRRDQVNNSLIVYSSQCHCTSVQTVTRPYINMIFILIMLHMRRLH